MEENKNLEVWINPDSKKKQRKKNKVERVTLSAEDVAPGFFDGAVLYLSEE